MSSPSTHAHFLALPKEIQVHILSYVLAQSTKPLALHSPLDRRWRNERRALHGLNPGRLRPTRKSDILNLLLVSKDFYFAGIKAYYGLNVLNFTPTTLKQFTKAIGIDRLRCVQSIVIHMGWQWPVRRRQRRLIHRTSLSYPVPVQQPECEGKKFDLIPCDYEDVLGSDLLACFPSLRSAVIRCSLVNPESGDRFPMVDKHMVEQIKSAWPSKHGAVGFPKGTRAGGRYTETIVRAEDWVYVDPPWRKR